MDKALEVKAPVDKAPADEGTGGEGTGGEGTGGEGTGGQGTGGEGTGGQGTGGEGTGGEGTGGQGTGGEGTGGEGTGGQGTGGESTSTNTGFEITLPEKINLDSYITIVAVENTTAGTLNLSFEQKSSAPSNAADVISQFSNYVWYLDGEPVPGNAASVSLTLTDYAALTPSSIHYITLQTTYDESIYTVTAKFTCQD